MTQMLEEIKQQPEVVRRIAERERGAVGALTDAVRHRGVRYVVVAARGTSDHAATYAKYLLEIENGMPVGLSAPSVHTLYGREVAYRDALVIGISQSGQSPDVAQVIEAARRQGALTGSISNNPKSLLSQTAEYPLHLHTSEERSVAATKTYTGTLALLALFSGMLKGASNPEEPLLDAADKMEEALQADERLVRLSQRYRYMQDCVVLSRGVNQATAAEAALKIIETSYVVAKPYSTADFMHGPFALVQEGFPVFLYAPEGAALPAMLEVARRLSESRAELVTVTHSAEVQALATIPIEVPFDIPEIYSPLVYIVYAQMFACRLAEARGYDPDTPRGLSKVTRTL